MRTQHTAAEHDALQDDAMRAGVTMHSDQELVTALASYRRLMASAGHDMPVYRRMVGIWQDELLSRTPGTAQA